MSNSLPKSAKINGRDLLKQSNEVKSTESERRSQPIN